MRRRITILAAVASALAVVLFAVPLAVVAARYLVSDERSELQRNAATVAAAVSGDVNSSRVFSLAPREGGTQVTVYDALGNRIGGDGPPHAAPLVLRAIAGTADTGTTDGRLAATVPISDGDTVTGAVLVTSNSDQVNGRIALALAGMVGLALLAITLTLIVARRYASRLVAPLDQLAGTAERVGAGEFTARAQPTGVTELDALGTAMNVSAQRVADMMQREREFTANASHQLRTPLAGLTLELEAALADGNHDPRPAIVNALATADRLSNTIATLLALARDTRTPAAVPISEVVDLAYRKWHGPLAATNRPLRIATNIDSGRRVLCSRPAVEQILDVLIDNATQHGRGAVTITVRDAAQAIAVDITDEGPALNTDPHVLFARRSAQAQGHGIGLALARTLAEADGARLNLTRVNPPTFTLLLRDADNPEPAQ